MKTNEIIKVNMPFGVYIEEKILPLTLKENIEKKNLFYTLKENEIEYVFFDKSYFSNFINNINKTSKNNIVKNNVGSILFNDKEKDNILNEVVTNNTINNIDNNIERTSKENINNSVDLTIVTDKKNINETSIDFKYTEFTHKHEPILKSMLMFEFSESGVTNPSEEYFNNILKENRIFSLNLILKIFMDHFSTNERHVNLLVSILHMLSHFDYEQVYPNAQTIAIAALSYDDVEVQEYAIKCFENWKHPDGIGKLEAIEFNIDWLKEYANDIITELKEVQENVVFSKKNNTK